MGSPLDDAFAKYLEQTGMATPEQLASARLLITDQNRLADVLVRQGVITLAQREAVEQKLAEPRLTQLGPYRLVRKLGEGGMGAVYLAEDTNAKRRVALKVLPQRFAKNVEFLKRFAREAESATRLEHENIVRGYATGAEKGHHWFAMEYCEGETLGARLKREGYVPAQAATGLVLQVARGLKYAHECAIIHRDIKPDNVMLTPGGKAKILDLGLSKDLDDPDSTFRTATGTALGTPHYLSPEQASGRKDVDGRADIYSLGATFYHLVTGEPPFKGASVFELVNKHLTEQLVDPRDLRPEISEGVSQVIRRMMAKKPEDRYRDCAALIVDLELLAESKAPTMPALDAAKSMVAPQKKSKRKPVPVPIVATVAAALAVIAVAIVLAMRDPKPETREVAGVPPPATSETPKPSPPPALPPAPPPPQPRVETEKPKEPETEPAKPNPDPEPPKPEPEKPKEEPKPPAESPKPPSKKPVPDAAAVKSASDALKKRFDESAPDYAASLLKAAPAEEAAVAYAMLVEARAAAAKTGDVDTVLAAADAMAEAYEVPSLDARFDGLRALVAPKSAESAKRVAEAVAATVEALLDAQRYGDVGALLRLAPAGDELAREWLAGAAATLQRNPNDAGAAASVGRVLCLVKDDWARGLPLLAKGSDATLKRLAQCELLESRTPELEFELCDGWLRVATAERGVRRESAAARARMWFDKLADADQAKLQKRLDALGPPAKPPSKDPPKPPATGAIDLMPYVVNDKNSPKAWTIGPKELVSPIDAGNIGTAMPGSARVRIRYQPPAEYDLEIELERRRTAPHGDLVVGLWIAGKQAGLGLDGWGGRAVGMCHRTEGWRNPRTNVDVFTTGKAHLLHIEVRSTGGVVWIDQESNRVWSWGVATEHMGIPPNMRVAGDQGLILGSVTSEYRITAIRLKPAGKDRGKVIE